jgi:hypothetical protein
MEPSMSLQTKVTETTDVAILCQNHRIYLEHAAKIGSKDSERRITFRTSALWKSGRAGLDAHGSLKIYFAPSAEGDVVAYQARLVDVLLEPEADDPETQRLLEHCLPETSDQGLWEAYDERVRTLYVISHCDWVEPPFSYTELTKLSDGTPVDENYNYGYTLVYEYCPCCQSSPCRCGG